MRTLWGVGWTLLALLNVVLSSAHVSALDTTSPPVDYYPPVYITAFQTLRSSTTEQDLSGHDVTVTTDALNVLELHNDTSDPIDLSEWTVEASDTYGSICTITLMHWLLPDGFVTMADAGSALEQVDATGNVQPFATCSQDQRTISKISLYRNDAMQEQLTPDLAGAFVRKNTTKTYRTGEFSHDFEPMDDESRTSFYAGVWYEPQPTTNLQIVETMAHARDCSPIEQATDCSDYVKLYNPTASNIVLDGLRLRIGYQGQNPTSSNTHQLSGSLPAGHFAALVKESDSTPLSITNSGGYIWLEDSYGVQQYDNTVVAYPSASSTTKIGWAWSLDPSDTTWKWTTTPTPYDGVNVFTMPAETESATAMSSLKPCRSDQYRNPLTNRCKLLSSSSSSLKPCAANQFRNPETNRCKSLSSSSSSLTPCKSNQFRNPETNRCKSIASTTSSLKPCNENQERNPATNRCRNKIATPTADYAVKAAKTTAEATVGWWAFGGAGVLAAGYAGWEWRKEIVNMIQKTASFFTFGK